MLDFDVTANRPDCLSVLGIAREIATVYGLPLKQGSGTRDQGSGTDQGPGTRDQSGATTIPITIEEPTLCRRYVGAIADVTLGPSPDWMQARLTACVVRPISYDLDVTNYVLL